MVTLVNEIALLAQLSAPTSNPTWENLIPWVVGFFAFLVSGVVFYVLKDMKGEVNALTKEIVGLTGALNRITRSVLLLVVTLGSAASKSQAQEILKETDDSERNKPTT